MKLWFWVTGVLILLHGEVLSTDIAPFLEGKTLKGITLLDQKVLDFREIGGIHFSGISDLAYDVRQEKLYLLSDEGKLFLFHTTFSNKIENLSPMSGITLTKAKGKRFKKWRHDSEGLTLDNHGELYISFEGKAKIARFDTKGRMLQEYRLPSILKDPKNYRSRNKSLEALAWHPRYGLLTVAEWPLKHKKKKEQTIYTLTGKVWQFKAEAERKSAVVAIEVIDDATLLVMERSFIDLIHPFVVTLKKVYLDKCNNKKRLCHSEVLLKMNSHEGWFIDNFEGLTKVGKNRYLMVSDDNDNFFQQTLLVYFEITH